MGEILIQNNIFDESVNEGKLSHKDIVIFTPKKTGHKTNERKARI